TGEARPAERAAGIAARTAQSTERATQAASPTGLTSNGSFTRPNERAASTITAAIPTPISTPAAPPTRPLPAASHSPRRRTPLRPALPAHLLRGRCVPLRTAPAVAPACDRRR